MRNKHRKWHSFKTAAVSSPPVITCKCANRSAVVKYRISNYRILKTDTFAPAILQTKSNVPLCGGVSCDSLGHRIAEGFHPLYCQAHKIEIYDSDERSGRLGRRFHISVRRVPSGK